MLVSELLVEMPHCLPAAQFLICNGGGGFRVAARMPEPPCKVTSQLCLHSTGWGPLVPLQLPALAPAFPQAWRYGAD